MRLSIVTCTKRIHPYLEWAIESLNNQTYKDFEYIVVDGLYDLRKDEILKLLEKAEFDWTYIPDKPSIWKGIGPALPNARNTGFIFAKGDQVVFHDDACKMDSNWLERHVKWALDGYCVAGSWVSYQGADSTGKWIEGVYGQETRSKQYQSPIECNGGWLYGCNFSVPIDAAIEANGNDELFCGQMGNEDCDFGIRVTRLGYRAIFDPLCVVRYFLGPAPEYAAQRIADQKAYLRASGKDIPTDLDVETAKPQKERMLESGESHFANEWLIQLLFKQPTRYWPIGNLFQISDLRTTLDQYRTHGRSTTEFFKLLENWKWPIEVDWRDCQSLRDMIK